MSDVAHLAARIRPYVSFSAGGMHVDVRKWLSHTKGKEMDEVERKARAVQAAMNHKVGGITPAKYLHLNEAQWGEVVDVIIDALSQQHLIDELKADRDSWAVQAHDRLSDWDNMRRRAESAEAELESLRAASQQPQGVPEDVQRTDCNFLFNLIKECRSHVRRTGIKGDDYGLCHESRTLALRYEQGDFEKAMELCRTLAAAPSPEAQS